jgi:putative nucleotidyltransferase with HDIG domain
MTICDDAVCWAARAPTVPQGWFRRRSGLHGVRHTQRVHIHAQRLTEEVGWARADAELVLRAALWHDIGRLGDGVEPEHGAASVTRADTLGLTAGLACEDAAVVRFAILRHSLPDDGAREHAESLAAAGDPARRLVQPERALRVLWLLKDADALDRVRLGLGERADPRQLRHARTHELLSFAAALYDTLH